MRHDCLGDDCPRCEALIAERETDARTERELDYDALAAENREWRGR